MLLTALISFALGLTLGWYLWAVNRTKDVTPDVAEPAIVTQPASPGEESPSQSQSPFERLEQRAIKHITDREFALALEVLEEADLIARTNSEIAQLATLLDTTVRQRVDQLEALQQHGAIDALYERLTLSMPERAEYYILLAEHRIRMQDGEAALPVLAQIENHHQLGSRARELIDEISRVDATGPLAAIPLIRAGDQFLVEAMIDGSRRVRLLIDTGASTTVIHPDVLDDLGYNLNGRMANFSTANGVVRAPLVAIAGLSLGDKSVQPLLVGALRISRPGNPVDGLLGMDFLRRFEFSIDQDGAVLNLLSLRES